MEPSTTSGSEDCADQVEIKEGLWRVAKAELNIAVDARFADSSEICGGSAMAQSFDGVVTYVSRICMIRKADR